MEAKLGQMFVLLPNALAHCHFLAFREAVRKKPTLSFFCVCMRMIALQSNGGGTRTS